MSGARMGRSGTRQAGRGVERLTKSRCFSIHRRKEGLRLRMIFRSADEKKAARAEGEMKNIEDLTPGPIGFR